MSNVQINKKITNPTNFTNLDNYKYRHRKENNTNSVNFTELTFSLGAQSKRKVVTVKLNTEFKTYFTNFCQNVTTLTLRCLN